MEQYDIQLFYWINSHHALLLDWMLWVASQPWCSAIVLLLAFIVMIVHIRLDGRYPYKYMYWLVPIGIGLCFLLSDQISVHCFKNVFHRLRPCHSLTEVRMFRTHCGGLYGFISSHAANSFSVALFLGLWWQRAFARNRRRNLPLVILLLWACVVGYSRPYLGKHYPGDVLCGALVGLFLGYLVYYIISRIERFALSKSTQ